MKFSIIIPVAKRHQKYLKRCLLSILDQDFNDWEAICVLDGFDFDLPIEDGRIRKVTYNEVKGASYARNTGAALANGEYLFFFDADCTLFPGMLTLIEEKFRKENPDFVYGAYRWNTDTLNVYHSRPFDPYLLESMNYISTMSPMKKEVFKKVGGFREDLPYFQDWDFFLRAVKDNGFEGYFVPDPLFTTEVSDHKSISGSPEYSFKDKVLHIERLNKIDSRELCVTTLSAPHQAIERAKVLNARYLGKHPNSGLIQTPALLDVGCRAVLLMGFFTEGQGTLESHMQVFPENSYKMVCWIGTDVWQLRNRFNWENIKFIKENYLSKIDKHFANSPQLVEELAELGIEAELLYQPLTETIETSPLPKRKTVSCYFSEKHPLHNKWFLQDIAQSMPDVKFLFYGSGFDSAKSDNCEYIGWRPINEIVKKCRVHLRLTAHDGFPHTPIQHLLGGRRVLCNFPLEYANVVSAIPGADNWEQLKPLIIGKLRELLAEKKPLDVKEISEYYYNLCNRQKYIDTVYGAINEKEETESINSLSQLQ